MAVYTSESGLDSAGAAIGQVSHMQDEQVRPQNSEQEVRTGVLSRLTGAGEIVYPWEYKEENSLMQVGGLPGNGRYRAYIADVWGQSLGRLERN